MRSGGSPISGFATAKADCEIALGGISGIQCVNPHRSFRGGPFSGTRCTDLVVCAIRVWCHGSFIAVLVVPHWAEADQAVFHGLAS